MKTLKHLLGLSIAILLLGGMFNTSNAQQKKELQYFRPLGLNGLNQFEATKADKKYDYSGFKIYWGAALTQQMQDLSQGTSGIDANNAPIQLSKIGPGFNLATANLYLDAQLAQGMRLHLTTYLSSRHHTDAYVKGGYLRIDALPMLNSEAINNLMKYVSIKIGHMEINYGDAHFYRSDNANALYNPLVGNYLMDSFTTEVGSEIYVMNKGFIGMLGLTGGQLHPQVTNPDGRRMSVYGKLGFDSKVGDNARVRLTGSFYHNARHTHLYHGDRAGSRYYDVLDAGAWSGRVEPGFSNGFTSFMINPFIQVGGFNLFGIIESSKEMKTGNSVQQYAADVQYFIIPKVFLAGRYDVVNGDLSGSVSKAQVNRVQIGGGWFLTDNVVAKVEYVNQSYKKGFDNTSLFNGAKFDGLMVEASIVF
jgi:hypothetical protein